MKFIIIASVIIILIWLLILSDNRLSKRFKAIVTSFVVASPIPPIP